MKLRTNHLVGEIAMVNSYTSGPWKVEEIGVGELFIVKPDKDGWRDRGFTPIAELSNDGAWANANLIAAAPDLLEAAKLALTSMSAQHAGTNPDTAYVKRTIQVAIAKAEGVQASP